MNNSSKQLPLFRRRHQDNTSSNVTSWLLHHRKRLALISVGILIFLFLGSRSTKSPDYSLQPETTPYRLDLSVWPTTLDNDNEQQQSAFASDMFTVDGPNSDLKAVTAVIYRISQDPDNIVRVVHHLLRYPFIREIYIHNPMTRQKLTVEVLYAQQSMFIIILKLVYSYSNLNWISIRHRISTLRSLMRRMSILEVLHDSLHAPWHLSQHASCKMIHGSIRIWTLYT